jgi:hypothetical protein
MVQCGSLLVSVASLDVGPLWTLPPDCYANALVDVDSKLAPVALATHLL